MKRTSAIWAAIISVVAIIVILGFIIWEHFGLAVIVMLDCMKGPDKKEIFELVEKNQTEIIKAIEESDYEDIKKIKGIEEVIEEENYIDFTCGGTGIGSSTSYYGFYYSEDNAIDVKENLDYPKGETLKPDGKGYSWDEPDGDNRFYVEKIIDGFFYYESHY